MRSLQSEQPADRIDPIDRALAEAREGQAGVRERLLRLLRQGVEGGDPLTARRAAEALVVHTVMDFADFRGLAEVWAVLDGPEAPPFDRPLDRLRGDLALLTRPLLDHGRSSDDPALRPVRARVGTAMREADDLDPDERLLIGKLLVDHDGMVNDLTGLEHVLTAMQDLLPRGSLRWQAMVWRLAANCYEYMGRTELARSATQQLQVLVERLGHPELDLALACEEVRQAMHTDDRPRAERAYRVIEQCRLQVRPALLPHGLRAQTALLLRKGDFQAALERTRLMLDICDDHEVPARDRAGYVEQAAHALAGLGRHAESVALLETLRATQVAGQLQVLEAIIAMARAVQALESGRASGAADRAAAADPSPDARAQVLHAVRASAAVGFHRFLMSFPAWAAQIAEIGLDAGVETEFLTHAIRERRLAPPQPWREHWPWPLQVRLFGGLQIRRDGTPLGGDGGKAQKKPMELLTLLAAHPDGLDNETLIDELWPSLEAQAPKSSLEMAVSRLRKALDLPESVRVSDGRISLHPGLVWTDVAAFEAAVLAGDADAALALYRGPLLRGDRVGGLLARARERLAARLVSGVLQRAAALQAEGHPQAVLALLGRGLAAEPGQPALAAALAAASAAAMRS
jgi:tetratricopeptide (TPR) repeat protein